MIEAASFVEAARMLGFTRYTGVPCSFLTPFINYVINDPALSYIASANEGDALATASGFAIGGQHELMGRITTQMLDAMQTPWEYFPDRETEIDAVLDRAAAYLQHERRTYALIMKKGAVAPHALRRDPVPAKTDQAGIRKTFFNATAPLHSRGEALARIMRHSPETDSLIIASTGFTGRELYAAADRRNQFYMVGSMGCASSLGLGLALARPDRKVIIVDGDGAVLMRLGNLATIGTYGRGNLYHALLDNGVHDSTGAQATVSPNVDFAAIAAACGYGMALSGNRLEVIEGLFSEPLMTGPRFAHLRIAPGTIANLPRPAVTPVQALDRLMQHLGSEF